MDLFSEPGSPWPIVVKRCVFAGCYWWCLSTLLWHQRLFFLWGAPFLLCSLWWEWWSWIVCLFDCLRIRLFTTQLRLSAKVSCFLYFWSNDGDQCLVKMVVSSEGEWLWRPTQFAWFEHRWISRTSFTLPIAKLKAQCIIPRGFQWILLFFLSGWSEYNYHFVIMLFWTTLLFSLYWLVFLFLICSCSLSYITLPAHKCLII